MTEELILQDELNIVEAGSNGHYIDPRLPLSPLTQLVANQPVNVCTWSSTRLRGAYIPRCRMKARKKHFAPSRYCTFGALIGPLMSRGQGMECAWISLSCAWLLNQALEKGDTSAPSTPTAVCCLGASQSPTNLVTRDLEDGLHCEPSGERF